VVFLFGGFAVLFVVGNKSPAEEERRTVLFPPAKEADRQST
jgi:hypothetical protein